MRTGTKPCSLIIFLIALITGLSIEAQGQLIGAGPARRVRSLSAAPATCNPALGEVYYHSGTAMLHVCTAADTWTALGSGPGGAASWGTITGTLSSQTDLQSALNAKSASTHGHAAAEITDSTITGRSVLVATDAAAARTAIGAGTSSFSGVYSALTGIPSTFAPATHTHPSSEVSDSTVTGRSVMTAATAAAARTAIGAGTSSFDGVYASLTSIPSTFTPSAHATSHSSGNTDPISHGNLAGLTIGDPHTQYQQESEKAAANGYASLDAGTKIPIAQIPTGTTSTTVPLGNDSRFTDARTPTAHATSHKSGGGDAIKLDELAAPTDVTTLNASATAHGLLPKLSNNAAQFLNGVGSWAAPSGGSDPWTVLQLGTAFATTSATAVDVTGLGFTPAANTTYEFEARLMIRTAGAATVNPRVGFAWPTGMTDGVVSIHQSQSATTEIQAHGNPNAAILIAVGGLTNNTQSWPARIAGMAVAGASPTGSLRVQLASETAGTSVSIIAGSFLRYRTVP